MVGLRVFHFFQSFFIRATRRLSRKTARWSPVAAQFAHTCDTLHGSTHRTQQSRRSIRRNLLDQIAAWPTSFSSPRNVIWLRRPARIPGRARAQRLGETYQCSFDVPSFCRQQFCGGCHHHGVPKRVVASDENTRPVITKLHRPRLRSPGRQWWYLRDLGHVVLINAL